MHTFKATIQLIGINPYVSVPEKILNAVFKQANKDKGPIPVFGIVNDKPYIQTLVKYEGEWRLYINTTMLKDSPKQVGKVINVTISFDPSNRIITPPEKFWKALKANSAAKAVYDNLIPSRRLEIIRYLSRLKTEEALDRNVTKAINFLLGKEKFIGRDKP